MPVARPLLQSCDERRPRVHAPHGLEHLDDLVPAQIGPFAGQDVRAKLIHDAEHPVIESSFVHGRTLQSDELVNMPLELRHGLFAQLAQSDDLRIQLEDFRKRCVLSHADGRDVFPEFPRGRRAPRRRKQLERVPRPGKEGEDHD